MQVRRCLGRRKGPLPVQTRNRFLSPSVKRLWTIALFNIILVLSKAWRRLERYAVGVVDVSTGAGAATLAELFDAAFFGVAFFAATFLADGFFFAAESVAATEVFFLAAGATFLAAGKVFLAEGPAFFTDAAAVLPAGSVFVTAGAACVAACFADFLAAGFEAVEATLEATFFAGAAAFSLGTAALTSLLSIKNALRFFAPAIQCGARPKPDHCLPVFGSAYFATEAALVFTFFAAVFPVPT